MFYCTIRQCQTSNKLRNLGSGRRTRDSPHVRRLLQERTDGAEENVERETVFSQASRRWNSLVFSVVFYPGGFTLHDLKCRRVNVMEQREFTENLSDIMLIARSWSICFFN